jgi:2-polyprenyl-6-methoxyphenol hydroxylase-like FAD-dependent oxidoreductase
MIGDWHPDLRRVIADCDPDSVGLFPFKSSRPDAAWDPTSVTLLGDAVHAMPPTGGLGANTALRDAHLLTRQLSAAARGETDLVSAIARYEAEMRDYGTAAVEASLKSLRAGLGHNPFGPPWFRVCQRIPAVKRMTFGKNWADPARPRDWEISNRCDAVTR